MYAHNIGKIQLSPIVSTISLCSLRGPHGALDSDVYWPAQDLEQTTNGPPITRTVARFIQVPAQDPLVCSSTRQCWLQLWVSCAVVRRCCDCTSSSAPTTKSRLDMNHLENTHCLVFVTYCAAPANLIWATPIWRRRCF